VGREKPWAVSQGFAASAGRVFGYLEERRALMRARAEAKNAPAEPTRARIAVGFSGELSHPPCACSGRVTARRRAKPRNAKADFFMDGLRWRVIDAVEGMDAEVSSSAQKIPVPVVPSRDGGEKTVIWYVWGISKPIESG
jgi:hypothetical protein